MMPNAIFLCASVCYVLLFISLSGVDAGEHEIIAGIHNISNSGDNGFVDKCFQEQDVWKCCVGVEMKLNFTSCISIQYLKDEYGLELNVTLNDFLIFHEKVSARNPPPICFAVPYLEKLANVCFRFHDLEEKNKLLKGCVCFQGHVEGFNVFKYELGCFEIPLLFAPNSIPNDVTYTVQMMNRL